MTQQRSKRSKGKGAGGNCEGGDCVAKNSDEGVWRKWQAAWQTFLLSFLTCPFCFLSVLKTIGRGLFANVYLLHGEDRAASPSSIFSIPPKIDASKIFSRPAESINSYTSLFGKPVTEVLEKPMIVQRVRWSKRSGRRNSTKE